uniref:Gamma-interferon-inducible lysosomal thiol reductase n=1 Tax=Hadrurus spadix TaxID=141984 RepID=A0A1W7RAG1_9SCOR
MFGKLQVTSRTMLGLGCISALLTVYWISGLIGVDLLQSKVQPSAPPVKLAIYYECLCPDSKRFIRNQLWRTYQAIPDLMKIELVPYGKAHETQLSNGTYAFSCQHGPNECYGNLVQTCAINLLNDTSKSLPFVNCMESYSDSHNRGETCAKRQDLNYNEILQCIGSKQGNIWQHEMAQKTENLNPRLHFVPWITVNGKYTQTYQRKALSDLLELVCNVYEGLKPEACL